MKSLSFPTYSAVSERGELLDGAVGVSLRTARIAADMETAVRMHMLGSFTSSVSLEEALAHATFRVFWHGSERVA